jgi:hypothetical protein
LGVSIQRTGCNLFAFVQKQKTSKGFVVAVLFLFTNQTKAFGL